MSTVRGRKALKSALASLKTDTDAARVGLEDTEGISTGSLAVDMVTGIGGFPLKRISEISGWESSGKTTVCLTAAARAQRDGHFVAYLDTENGLDKTHAERIGFDFKDEEKGIYMAPDSLESTMKIIESLVQTDECRLIIVDSVPGMVPQAILDGDIEEVGQIAQQARLLSSYIPRIAKLINKHDTALVFVNQMRMKINTGWQARFKGSEETSSGGSVLKFFAALRLQTLLVKRGAATKKISHPLTGKEEDIAVANLHRVDAVKNKVAAPYREAQYYIRYDTSGIYGVDNITTVVFLAVAKGLLAKKGSYFQYSGAKNFSVQGEDGVYLHLFENPETLVEICQALGISAKDL